MSTATPFRIAVVDQEAFGEIKQVCPKSFDWDNPDQYLLFVEETAREAKQQGLQPLYVFIEPSEYVDWCRAQNLPVDSSSSRAAFVGTIDGDGVIPYDSKQPLWGLAVVYIVLRSELGEAAPLERFTKIRREFFERYVEACVNTLGRWRCVVTASRFAEHNDDDLWLHFADALSSTTTMTHCADYLSVVDEIVSKSNRIEVPDHGWFDPIEMVMALAEAGHGLVGVEHRHGKEVSFRAFHIAQGRYDAVPVDEIRARLDVPNDMVVYEGW